MDRGMWPVLTVDSGGDEESKGRNYLIFPEGTRAAGQRSGFTAAFARHQSSAPFVPIALIDCFKVLAKGQRPGEMEIHYLPVIDMPEYADMKPPTGQLGMTYEEKIRQVRPESLKEYSHDCGSICPSVGIFMGISIGNMIVFKM